jgi:hypothetical protein
MGALLLVKMLLVMAAFAGCEISDAPETAPVQGKVTFQGRPLAHVGVTFFPESKGPIATGNTDEKGEFTLTTVSPGDGAPVGMNKVTFGKAEEGPAKSGAVAIPERYTRPSTSEFTAEVKPRTNNVFTFDLKP